MAACADVDDMSARSRVASIVDKAARSNGLLVDHSLREEGGSRQTDRQESGSSRDTQISGGISGRAGAARHHHSADFPLCQCCGTDWLLLRCAVARKREGRPALGLEAPRGDADAAAAAAVDAGIGADGTR